MEQSGKLLFFYTFLDISPQLIIRPYQVGLIIAFKQRREQVGLSLSLVRCGFCAVLDSYQSNLVLILYIATVQLFKHFPSLPGRLAFSQVYSQLPTSLNQFPFGTYHFLTPKPAPSYLPPAKFTMVRYSCVSLFINDWTGAMEKTHAQNRKCSSTPGDDCGDLPVF